LGQIETKSYKLTGNGRTYYDSGSEFFEETASREKFKSNRFMELALDFSTAISNRDAARWLNRMRHEPEGISPTTFRNNVEREGRKIQECMEAKCDEILVKNGFTINGELSEVVNFEPGDTEHIEQEKVDDAAVKLNINSYKVSDYESPETAVNVSIDDVCVKRQTETRPRNDKVMQPKRVDNTVIHVQNNDGRYILNAASLLGALKLLIGFLLHNNILNQQIVVFADGARSIHSIIQTMLGFANFKIILDWYHLDKKCREQLSMALRGRKIRNEFLKQLLPCLWFGNVDSAISLLRNIDPDKVKDNDKITKLIEYFERVRGYVPCYALRKELGLRNSSNQGEKANDIVVANRQKHNGMSWSDDGSVAFASVSAATFNGELNNWVINRDFNFKPVQKAA
jgi:hypothetical protein